jgi:hypothetical protein
MSSPKGIFSVYLSNPVPWATKFLSFGSGPLMMMFKQFNGELLL